MEHLDQPQESSLFGLNVDPVIKSHLFETARWGKFLAIVGFVVCGLIVVGGIFMVTAFSTFERRYSGYNSSASLGAVFGPSLAIIYVLISILYFFPCLFLLRFSNKMKTALATDNQAELTLSFQNLKALFRYVGILTIIVLSLYALAIVFGGLGALMSR